MRYLALAADYDGTIAHDGVVKPNVLAAFEQLKASGRKLLLVTGRELDELLGIFPEITLFDRVVAENGALLYRPATGERKLLTAEPPPEFVAELRRRGVPLSVGDSIVATVEPHETAVLEVIRDMGLELQVIFNKGAVMILPPGVNKASGLCIALAELGLSQHNVVAVGDGENDHALLDIAEYSMAVANAIPMLKEKADRVAAHTHGDGVIELIADLVANDLSAQPPRTLRRSIVLGTDGLGAKVTIPPAGISVLIAGSSGSGRSTLASGMLESLRAQHYQFCVVDFEGDYEHFSEVVVFGNAQRGPTADEISTALEKPDVNVAINLRGLPLQERPSFFLSLMPRLQELRARTGRPHWILINDAHHLLPAEHAAASSNLDNVVYVTGHSDLIAPALLKNVSVIASVGDAAGATIEKFSRAVGVAPPTQVAAQVGAGQALLWWRDQRDPVALNIAPNPKPEAGAGRH
jgi:hydroxymethylpyrimidine pyrophosphatase-like HAD family hydrolase